MTEYTTIPATEDHAWELVEHMHPADVVELWAAGRITPIEMLLRALKGSRDAMAGLADDELVCMFGVVRQTALSSVGYPWLITSPLVKNHSTAFLRRTKAHIENIRGRYDLLYNVVDMRNEKAFRWMAWLGFTQIKVALFGPDQRLFAHFYMEGR